MSHKISRWFANAIRSWPFFFIYVVWSVAWWSYVGEVTFDPRPWLVWSVITTFITEVDLIVYGIYQRIQSRQDELIQRSQLDTMKLLVALAEHLTVQQEVQGAELDEILKRVKEE